jgi:hypothetical protein
MFLSSNEQIEIPSVVVIEYIEGKLFDQATLTISDSIFLLLKGY